MKIKVSGVPYEVDIDTLEQENRQMRARMNRLEEENKLLQERELVRLTEHKPVAWVYNGILHEFDPSEFATSEVTPLYTAPPKREWVEQSGRKSFIVDRGCWERGCMAYDCRDADVVIIEAKLKEKNT